MNVRSITALFLSACTIIFVIMTHQNFDQITLGWTQDRIILFVLNSIIGVSLMADAIWAIFMAEAAKSWPVAQGRIVSSRVSNYDDPQLQSGQAYKATIHYEYKVGTNWYLGNRIRFEGGASNLLSILACILFHGLASATTANSTTREAAKQLVQTNKDNYV